MSDTGLYEVTRYEHIGADGTFIQRSGQVKLKTVITNVPLNASGTVTVYNSATGSGPIVSVIDANGDVVPLSSDLQYNLVLASGLTAVANGFVGGVNFTVIYQ